MEQGNLEKDIRVVRRVDSCAAAAWKEGRGGEGAGEGFRST